VWLLAWGQQNQLLRLDRSTLEQLSATTLVGYLPHALTSGEGAMWSADNGRGTVWRVPVDTATAGVVTRVAFHPISIAEHAGTVWVGVQADRLR
jgi:hypothetical protein